MQEKKSTSDELTVLNKETIYLNGKNPKEIETQVQLSKLIDTSLKPFKVSIRVSDCIFKSKLLNFQKRVTFL